jgi:hypothetical protein
MIHGFKRDLAISAAFTAGDMYIQGCPGCANVIEMQRDAEGKYLPLGCKHQPGEYPGLKNSPIENDRNYVGWKWALQTCEQYFEFYKNDYWIPLEVEIVKSETLYEDDEIRVVWKAKFDWIVDTLQGILSVDHKTSKQRRNTLSLNNQFMGQCILMKTRKVMLNKIGFQTTLKPEEKFTRNEMCYTAERLIEWQSQTLPHYAYMYLNYIETGYWPQNFTHCETKFGDCIMVPHCEANPNMRAEVVAMHYVKGPEWNPENIEE